MSVKTDESFVSPSITDISDSSIDIDDEDDGEEDRSCQPASPECSCSSLNSDTASTIACTSDNIIQSRVPLVAVQDSPGATSASSASTSTASTVPIDVEVAIQQNPLDKRHGKYKVHLPTAKQHLFTGSGMEDNLSESIATTTTEVDLDQDLSSRTDAPECRLSPAAVWKTDTGIVRSCSIRSKRSLTASFRSSIRPCDAAVLARQKSASHGQLPQPHSLPVVVQIKPKIRVVEFIRRIFKHFKVKFK